MDEFENNENTESTNENNGENTTTDETTNDDSLVKEEAKPKKVCQCAKVYRILFYAVLTNLIISFILVITSSVILYKVFKPQPVIINNPMRPGMAFQDAERGQRMPMQRQANKARKMTGNEKPLFEKGILGNNFKSYAEAKQSDKKMLVLFYADWCPHCQRFSATFEKLSKDKDLKKTFNFVPMNSQLPETRAIMEEYQVQGFPALFVVNNKTAQKTFIPNNLLFGDDAIKELKDIVLRIK